MLLCLASYPSNVQLSMRYLEAAQSCRWAQQQGKGEAGFTTEAGPKGRDPAVWGPRELSGPSWIDTALPELPERYVPGVAFPRRTGDYKPSNAKAWSISSCGWLVFPMPPNCTTSTVLRLQQVYSCKTESPFSAVPSLLPSGAISHPFFCSKTLPKFKTLRGN